MDQLTKILLISDNETSCFLQHRLLLRYGVTRQVVLAPSPQEALTQLATADGEVGSDSPNLILLDMGRPREIITFLQTYKRLPQPQQVPLVVLSISLSFTDAELEQLQALRIASLIDKPLTKEKAEQLVHLARPSKADSAPLHSH